MKFRWTIQDLREKSNNEILRGIVAERISTLHPYTQFAKKLSEIYSDLDKIVNKEMKAKQSRS